MATRRALTQPQLHSHLPLFRSLLHTHPPLSPHLRMSCPHTFVPPYFPTLQRSNDPTILLTFLPTFLRPYLRPSLHVHRTRRPRSSRGPTMPSGATLASTGLRRPRWVHVGSRSECTCRNASAGLRRPRSHLLPYFASFLLSCLLAILPSCHPAFHIPPLTDPHSYLPKRFHSYLLLMFLSSCLPT